MGKGDYEFFRYRPHSDLFVKGILVFEHEIKKKSPEKKGAFF